MLTARICATDIDPLVCMVAVCERWLACAYADTGRIRIVDRVRAASISLDLAMRPAPQRHDAGRLRWVKAFTDDSTSPLLCCVSDATLYVYSVDETTASLVHSIPLAAHAVDDSQHAVGAVPNSAIDHWNIAGDDAAFCVVRSRRRQVKVIDVARNVVLCAETAAFDVAFVRIVDDQRCLFGATDGSAALLSVIDGVSQWHQLRAPQSTRWLDFNVALSAQEREVRWTGAFDAFAIACRPTNGLAGVEACTRSCAWPLESLSLENAALVVASTLDGDTLTLVACADGGGSVECAHVNAAGVLSTTAVRAPAIFVELGTATGSIVFVSERRLVLTLAALDVDRDELCRRVIVYRGIDAAERLCALNEWPRASLHVLALQIGLAQRQLSVLAPTLAAMSARQLERQGVPALLHALAAPLSDDDRRDDATFRVHLIADAMRVVARRLSTLLTASLAVDGGQSTSVAGVDDDDDGAMHDAGSIRARIGVLERALTTLRDAQAVAVERTSRKAQVGARAASVQIALPSSAVASEAKGDASALRDEWRVCHHVAQVRALRLGCWCVVSLFAV
jgi:hypothetical protein